jgi:hypothetical protein
MRLMTIKEAHAFVTAEPPKGLGMKIKLRTFEARAEPRADGKRRLPFFKEPGGGKNARLLVTDEALREFYQRLSDEALRDVAA